MENLDAGLFVEIEEGWVQAVWDSMVDFHRLRTTYPNRGHPMLVMNGDVGDGLAAVIPCGYDDHAVLNLLPYYGDLPHGLITTSGIVYEKPHYAWPGLVCVAPKKVLRGWPVPAAPSDLKVHGLHWKKINGLYVLSCQNKCVEAAKARFSAAA